MDPDAIPQAAVDAMLDAIGYGRRYPPPERIREGLAAAVPLLLSSSPEDAEERERRVRKPKRFACTEGRHAEQNREAADFLADYRDRSPVSEEAVGRLAEALAGASVAYYGNEYLKVRQPPRSFFRCLARAALRADAEK